MGDRICLTFVSRENILGLDGPREERSPVLYAHWDGMALIRNAKRFWEAEHDRIRSEPSNFMVNFISWLRRGEVADGMYYICNAGDECGPDDNGWWEMDTRTGEVTHPCKGDYEHGDLLAELDARRGGAVVRERRVRIWR